VSHGWAFRAKPESVCRVELNAVSPLPVGRVDLNDVPSG
jgi:hypothetical protein